MRYPAVVIGIQCRISSSRLPCKALLKLANTTILGMCIARAKASGYPVFLLTSDHEEDDLIAESASRYGATGVIRGSLNNVLSRYAKLAEVTFCDYIVRVTADNPLTEYGFIDPLVKHASLKNLPYVWVEPSYCPEGTNIEIFSKEALLESTAFDDSSQNLEHVTPYMRRNLSADQSLVEIASRFFPFDCKQLSFTVDTLSDYVILAKLVNSVLQEFDIGFQSPDFVQVCANFAFSNSSSYAFMRNHPV